MDDTESVDDTMTDDSDFSLESQQQQASSAPQQEDDFDFSLESSNDPTPPSLDWGEEGDGGIPQDYHATLAQVAKDLGYDNSRSARLLARAYSSIVEQETKAGRAIAQDLRKQWGENFNANIRETKRFWNDTLRGANIPPEARAILGSPYGMMLGNYLRSRIQGGEASRFAGSGNTQSSRSVEQEIDAIYNDPKTSRATWDTSDPMYNEVQKRLNGLMQALND